ncbi:MAG: hypothetical protein AAF802_19255, partial [Planctomycetota bacterium]
FAEWQYFAKITRPSGIFTKMNENPYYPPSQESVSNHASLKGPLDARLRAAFKYHLVFLIFGVFSGFFWLGFGLAEQSTLSNLMLLIVVPCVLVSILSDLYLLIVSAYSCLRYGRGAKYFLASLVMPALIGIPFVDFLLRI